MKKVILPLFVCFLFAGCIETIDQSGNKKIQLDPNAARILDTGAAIVEQGASVGAAISIFWPAASLITGVLGGIAGAWRKLKPQITEANATAKVYYNVTDSIVAGIEKFKETNPTEWDSLAVKLEKAIGPEAENVIRRLRGLPEKA